MLILTAAPGESIYLTNQDGQEVEILYSGKDSKYPKKGSGEIRLCFTAPLEVNIERESVREKRINAEIDEAHRMNEEYK